MYKKIVIGVDQSYEDTGISIAADSKLRKVTDKNLSKYKNNSERRGALRETLNGLLSSVEEKGDEVICIIERIRLQSQGFINIDYIKSIGALNSIIVDVCREHNVKVYSVDTRCWKAQVVGTSKSMSNKFSVAPEKWPTIKWVIKQGFEDSIITEITNKRKKKGVFTRNGKRYSYNDNAADSAGIAMFGFIGDKEKLLEEH